MIQDAFIVINAVSTHLVVYLISLTIHITRLARKREMLFLVCIGWQRF